LNKEVAEADDSKEDNLGYGCGGSAVEKPWGAGENRPGKKLRKTGTRRIKQHK